MSSKVRAVLATTEADHGAMLVFIPGSPKGAMPKSGSVHLHTGRNQSVVVTKVKINRRWHTVLRVLGSNEWQFYRQLCFLLSETVAEALASDWTPKSLKQANIPMEVRNELFLCISDAMDDQRPREASQDLLTPMIAGNAQPSWPRPRPRRPIRTRRVTIAA